MIDTGPWMLLRLRVDGQASTQWVAVSAREAGPAWHLLRTAVFVQPPQTLEADPAGARAQAVVEGDADALLVERVKQGDTRAFEMLVVKYQRRIERLIGRMVRDVDLVQDIAQESFIRAYRALPQFRGDSAFTPGCTASR